MRKALAVNHAIPRLSWPAAPAPGIAITQIQRHHAVALLKACEAVDKDVERSGAVSVETVEQVRAALALLRSK